MALIQGKQALEAPTFLLNLFPIENTLHTGKFVTPVLPMSPVPGGPSPGAVVVVFW